MLNLQIKAETIEITNKNKGFKGSIYADSEFKITMKSLSSVEHFESLKKSTMIENEKEDIDMFELNILLLQKSIISWEGIGADNKELECTKENIKAIFEYSSDFAKLIMKIFTEDMQKIKKKQKN